MARTAQLPVYSLLQNSFRILDKFLEGRRCWAFGHIDILCGKSSSSLFVFDTWYEVLDIRPVRISSSFCTEELHKRYCFGWVILKSSSEQSHPFWTASSALQPRSWQNMEHLDFVPLWSHTYAASQGWSCNWSVGRYSKGTDTARWLFSALNFLLNVLECLIHLL